MFKSKRIIIALLGSIAAFSLFFYFAIPRIVGWQMGRVCYKCLEGNFTADAIDWDWGGFVIEHPVLTVPTASKESNHTLSCKQAILSYQIAPWKREIKVSVSLISPQLVASEQIEDLLNAIVRIEPISRFIEWKFDLKVNDGVLVDPLKGSWEFDLDADFGDNPKGSFAIAQAADNANNKGSLSGRFQSEPSVEERLVVSFDQFEIDSLDGMGLSDRWLKGLSIDHGKIHGDIHLSRLEGAVPKIRGILEINELAFEYAVGNLKGKIPKSKIELDACPLCVEAINSDAKVKFNIGAGLFLSVGSKVKNEEAFFELGNVAGSFELAQESALLNFKGTTRYGGQELDFLIDSNAKLVGKKVVNGDFVISMHDDETVVSGIHFAFHSKGNTGQVGELEIKNFRKAEFHLLQAALLPYYPQLRFLQMHDGVIDAHLSGHALDRHPNALYIDNVDIKDLQIALPEWQLAMLLPKATGSMTLDFIADNIFNTINADIVFEGATINCESVDAPAENINAQLRVRKGHLERSTFEGNFAGLQGTVLLDSSNPKEIAKANFHGDVQKLAKLLPDHLRRGIHERFTDDSLDVNVAVSRHEQGVSIEAGINVFDPKRDQPYPLLVNFNLIKTSNELWGHWPPHQQSADYWRNNAWNALKTIMPPILAPMALFGCEAMKNEAGWKGLLINEGRFQGKGLCLHKFVEPFLFELEQFSLHGKGDFIGTFDFDGAIVDYFYTSATLENDDINMEVVGGDDDAPLLWGRHHFDFNRSRDSGELWVKKGFYFDKKHTLLFSDLSAHARLVGSKIYVEELATCCNQMQFAGSIDIDYSCPDPGFYDVDVYVDSMQGKASHLLGIFSHFPALESFSRIPIDGDVSLNPFPGVMHFAFEPDDFRLQAKALGVLTNGSISDDCDNLAVEKLSFTYAYDHEAKTLQFENIDGELQVGRPGNHIDYTFDGSRINIADLGTLEADFNFSLIEKAPDVNDPLPFLRLTGICRPISNSGLVEFVLDPVKTQFAGTKLKAFELVVNQQCEVDSFHLNLPFELAYFSHKLTPPLQAFMQKEGAKSTLSSLPKLSGQCGINLRYQSSHAQLFFNLDGANIGIGDNSFNTVVLNGKKKAGRWSIEQLQLDDLAIAANLLREDNKLCCDFIGLRWGNTLLAGLVGDYYIDKNAFEGQINLLEIDLSHLHKIPICSDVASAYSPTGNLKATGKVRAELINDAPGLQVDATLKTSFQELQLKGINFDLIQNLPCRFASNEEISFGPLSSTYLSNAQRENIGAIEFKKADLNFISDAMTIDSLHLVAESSQLSRLADQLRSSFPDEVSVFSADLLRECKKIGHFSAYADIKSLPNDFQFNLKTPDGKYYWAGFEHEINNFSLESCPEGTNIIFQYRLSNYPFWVYCKSIDPFTGKIFCSSERSTFQKINDGRDLLTINWRDDPIHGFTIDSLQGAFCGLGASLQCPAENAHDKNKIVLEGDLAIDVPVAAKLLSPEIELGLAAAQIGRGYTLRGRWHLNRDGNESGGLPYQFSGVLLGNDIEFKGYQFQRLQAGVESDANKIIARNLWLQDSAGSVHIENMTLISSPAHPSWTMALEDITVSNFRPSMLQHAGEPPPPMTTSHFVIPKFQIPLITGVLSNPQSYTGRGYFDFSNRSKKVMHHPLFVIPTEILHRIGLDLAVLNPVTGIVYFDVHDGKFFLTKFKDVYSEGKLSKFYLPSNDRNSYVDFDGNLHLQVKMKQYNLLFKLAELVTVSVSGTLQRPIYSLQKQLHKNRPLGIRRSK
jgi:hypothetical protein